MTAKHSSLVALHFFLTPLRVLLAYAIMFPVFEILREDGAESGGTCVSSVKQMVKSGHARIGAVVRISLRERKALSSSSPQRHWACFQETDKRRGGCREVFDELTVLERHSDELAYLWDIRGSGSLSDDEYFFGIGSYAAAIHDMAKIFKLVYVEATFLRI